FQAEDGIRDFHVTGVQTCALPISALGEAGVSFEDKGMSIALHYRLADDPDIAVAAIERALQGLDPALHRFGGKYVVNVTALSSRSEERRVGKECRSRVSRYD